MGKDYGRDQGYRMTGIVDAFRKKFSYAEISGGKLTRDGCKVSLAGAPRKHMVLDLDRRGLPLAGHETRCDFLFIAENVRGANFVVPMELKRGEFKAGKIVEQLQAGTKFVEDHLPDDESPHLIPVAATGSISTAMGMALKRNQIYVSFLGKKSAIRRIRCGAPLITTWAEFSA